ncbi:hypothetical protein J6590_103225, partial [Homalodisca vitripennis]
MNNTKETPKTHSPFMGRCQRLASNQPPARGPGPLVPLALYSYFPQKGFSLLSNIAADIRVP